MSRRLPIAIAAMIVVLATGWLTLAPVAAGATPGGLRTAVSILLLFGIAFLAAALALAVERGDPHR